MHGIEQIPWLYDGMMSLFELFGLGRWRRQLVARAKGRVLEVGCGTGRNLGLYAAPVVGIDIELDALLKAKKRAPGARLVLASAEALPFPPASFDTVVSCLVFCSVPNVPKGLAEIGRVLHDGGELHMMEHVRHERPFLGRLQDLVQPFWTWCAGGCHPNRNTEAAVAAAGFEIDPASRRKRGAMRLFSARRARGMVICLSAQVSSRQGKPVTTSP